MTVFQWSNQCFNIASILYAIAFVLYAGMMVSSKNIYMKGSTILGRLAWGTHTLALILRWVHAGIGHPPWTNLYESLVFFAWGVMGAHLFLEVRFKFKFTGVFACAVTFAAMGIASLHPNKEIEPLVPALQSWWLLFHVFMACIAYSFFLGSSFISVFYLLKDEIKVETMSAYAALACLIFLCLAVGTGFFTTGELQFYKVVQMQGKDVIMNFKDSAGNQVKEFISMPFTTWVIWPTLVGYLSTAALFFAKKDKWAKKIYLLTIVLHVAVLISILMAPRMNADFSLKSNPYRLASIFMTLGISFFFASLFKLKDKILLRLPDEPTLDRLSYEAILIGVPFMTLNLVSGAVWAYYAWGRYWGWDPKETWAFITWLIYVLYLHVRITSGWRGRKTAIISIIGFFVVIFTYLGVNLVISGLHSYATG